MPVRALTSEVLPWSMWPAVPRIRVACHEVGFLSGRGLRQSHLACKTAISQGDSYSGGIARPEWRRVAFTHNTNPGS